MNWLAKKLVKLLSDEEAPTMVEYGLLILLIAIVAIVGASAMGLAILNLFEVPPPLM